MMAISGRKRLVNAQESNYPDRKNEETAQVDDASAGEDIATLVDTAVPPGIGIMEFIIYLPDVNIAPCRRVWRQRKLCAADQCANCHSLDGDTNFVRYGDLSIACDITGVVLKRFV